ncbi:PEP-CTERM sorting domain-containing protein [Aquabacterium sp. CECT 9606]|uniref:PEP-CTERM sorting domain-containing protein n=1 Tax=Aquabacterium sp. CECT 9606 TaxID=2845822 RepID=UPI001E3D0B1B|nr:PEP-CTERM sorting domain-containing protein [Aquabacterium sp. CECT 9606]CAH0350893.1 hypothetical protein AQB9606_01820 [Aquabacterium sp. CECT 9606]
MKFNMTTGLVVATLAAIALSHQASASVVTIGNGNIVQTSQYVANAATTDEVHVIGLYDGGSSGPNSNSLGVYIPGTTVVNVLGSSTGAVSLVLSAYERTNWFLMGDGVASLTSVVINGYGASQAFGIDGGKVVNRSGQGNYIAACGYSLPYNGGGCDTSVLISGIESYLGKPITTFTGLYSSSLELGTLTSLDSPAALQVTVRIGAVPEPSTVVLIGMGFGALLLMRQRRQKR